MFTCDDHFTMYVSQIIILYILNLYTTVYQLYLNKTELKAINCLMEHSRSGKQISFNFLHLTDINMFYSWSVCFHTDLKPSHADSLLSLLCLKFFWKKVSLPGLFFLNYVVSGHPFYCPGALTSLCCLVSCTVLSMRLPPSILCFS